MTFLDIVVAVVLVIFLVRGVWTGFVRQIAFIAGLLLGFVAAGQYCKQFARLTTGFIDDPQLGFLVSYAVLFLLVYILVMVAGVLLKKVMQITFLGWFDRMLGGIFGLAKAVFISSLLFMILAGFMSNSEVFLKKSICYPFLSKSSRYILNFIRDRELRSRFLPSSPAISPLFTEQFFSGSPAENTVAKPAGEDETATAE